MPFRNYKEKISGFKKLDKEIEIHFGIPKGYQLSHEYYNFLDNYMYENKISTLSGSVIQLLLLLVPLSRNLLISPKSHFSFGFHSLKLHRGTQRYS